jgi:hypothetical protein
MLFPLNPRNPHTRCVCFVLPGRNGRASAAAGRYGDRSNSDRFLEEIASMNDLAVSPAPVVAEVGLDDFFQRLASTNPFTDNRVNGPCVRAPDVAGIHQAAFERLTDLAHEASRERRGLGAVLWGEAGIGKSHVLARLARWAEHDQQAFLVYLHNLQAAPEYLPRSLLHAVVSILTQGRRHHLVGTPLYRLVYGAVLESVGGEARYYKWSQLDRAFAVLIDRMGREGNGVVDRTIYEVLFRFFHSACEARQGREDGRSADLAVRWLSGQALEPAEAHALGLPPAWPRDEVVALADNQQIKQVLLALSRLAAGRGRPFVLAFDQVDNLDAEQMAALARFLEALIDGAPDLLVVLAGIQSSLLRWRQEGVIQESAWHRLAQTELRLHRLTVAEATQIVRSRLEDFLAPFATLPSLQARRAQDALFPLGQPWHERFLRDRVDVRPRDALNWAREGWRMQQEHLRQQGGSAWLEGWPGPAPGSNGDGVPPRPEQLRDAIDHAVDERLAAHVAWRQSEPQGLPPDADHLAGLVYALLATCRDAKNLHGIRAVERVSPQGARPTYQLIVQRDGPADSPRSIGVLAVMTGNATSAAGSLRRLREDLPPPGRVLLVTDARLGLPLGDRGREYLHALEQGGPARFLHLELSFAEYAELDALETVVGLARSGDLEIETYPGQARAVREAEVIESLQRRGRYLASRLLREILQNGGERGA